jgi:transposase-like protein
MRQPFVTYRYSLAFKQKVIHEIESGKLSIEKARRIYDIGGTCTIQKWLKKLGKHHLLYKVVRIEMKDERDKLRELEKQKKELESALAQEHLRNLSLEALIESIEEHYGIDVKKNFGGKASKKYAYKPKNKG